MPTLKPGTIWPTPEEDAAITEAIAADPDTEEITAEMFKQARPAIEAHPHLVAESLLRRRKQEGLMEWEVSVKLDTDVLAHFLAGGPDWQQRINDTLRQALFNSPDRPPLGGE